MPEQTIAGAGPTRQARSDPELVEGLRERDERAFTAPVDRYHARLVRLAMAFGHDRGTAEQVAQQAWLGVLRGVDRFDGGWPPRTWIYRILTGEAKTRAIGDGRADPLPLPAGHDDAGPVNPSGSCRTITSAGRVPAPSGP